MKRIAGILWLCITLISTASAHMHQHKTPPQVPVPPRYHGDILAYSVAMSQYIQFLNVHYIQTIYPLLAKKVAVEDMPVIARVPVVCNSLRFDIPPELPLIDAEVIKQTDGLDLIQYLFLYSANAYSQINQYNEQNTMNIKMHSKLCTYPTYYPQLFNE